MGDIELIKGDTGSIDYDSYKPPPHRQLLRGPAVFVGLGLQVGFHVSWVRVHRNPSFSDPLPLFLNHTPGNN